MSGVYMLSLIFLLSGFVPLIYGGNLLVDAATALAKRFNIPNIVIGLTIVSFGTSAPELVVNIFAAINHNSSIVLGNVLGSNIVNILGILGVSAIIYPLTVKSNTTWIEVPLCLMSVLILFVTANDVIIDHASISSISRIDGIILLSFFLIFISYNFQLIKSGEFSQEIPTKNYTTLKSILFMGLGLALLMLGGKIIVQFATKLAFQLGFSERVIALTIVSLGTSLPEMVTSIIAAMKRNVDIAIGNIVGSNIFNVFLILGVSSTIYPVEVPANVNFDLGVNIVASLLLFMFIFTGKGRKIERWEGILFNIFYLAYIAVILIKP